MPSQGERSAGRLREAFFLKKGGEKGGGRKRKKGERKEKGGNGAIPKLFLCLCRTKITENLAKLITNLWFSSQICDGLWTDPSDRLTVTH